MPRPRNLWGLGTFIINLIFMPGDQNSPSSQDESVKDSTPVQDDVKDTGNDNPQDEQDSTPDKDNQDKKAEPSKKDSDNPEPYYTIGNHVFNSKEELAEFASKNYGEVGRLTGELKNKKTAAVSEIINSDVKLSLIHI